MQSGVPSIIPSSAATEIFDWISNFVMQPNKGLGRKGAVCPFMDSAFRAGRLSFNAIRIDGSEPTAALRTAATGWLSRIKGAADGGDYEAVLFAPYGADELELRRVVTEVQSDLRATGIERGCMIGTFYPGHPEPGIRNSDFRPLDSPRSLMGIRTMVDTDIHFLVADGPSSADREHAIKVWQGYFADRAARSLVAMSEAALRT